MTVYNKLVRDLIPEIIEKKEGRSPITRILSDNEYIEALSTKLDEEVAEYHEAKNAEELADILEVLLALAVTHGHSTKDLERLRADKLAKRGGFTKKIFLIED